MDDYKVWFEAGISHKNGSYKVIYAGWSESDMNAAIDAARLKDPAVVVGHGSVAVPLADVETYGQ